LDRSPGGDFQESIFLEDVTDSPILQRAAKLLDCTIIEGTPRSRLSPKTPTFSPITGWVGGEGGFSLLFYRWSISQEAATETARNLTVAERFTLFVEFLRTRTARLPVT